jgi:ketosteroid isomerase-like protein
MTHPNEELIRRGYDAFSKGDLQTLRELFDPNIVWHAPGRNQLAGDHQGVDTVLGYFGRTMELTGGTFRVELHDVVANEQHTVGLHTAYAERGGQTLEGRSTLVFHLQGGRVIEVWQLWEDLYAADALFA